MKIRLGSFEKHRNKLLKDPKFKEAYELERVKVALAQKIAEIRDDRKLKQSDIARRMHVSQQFISQVESGENNLTLETLFNIARSLDTNIQISFSEKTSRHACLKIS